MCYWNIVLAVTRHAITVMIRGSTVGTFRRFLFGHHNVARRAVRFRSPALNSVVGRLAGALIWSIFRTTRNELHTGQINPYDIGDAARFLMCVWHDSAVMAAFGGRHKRTVALTSRHRDGTFVENVLRSVNVPAVRGSSGKNGASAALSLLRLAQEKDIVITPDGPRGPRRTMSRGIVYLASKTGNGIVPTAFAASKYWDIKGSWTSLTIPKPFSRLVLIAGDPIYVPAGLDDEGLEHWRLSVQQEMDALQGVAELELASRTGHPPESIQPANFDKAA